jgi:aryl-alcohol dehydrogenase-like predicted oxidoreductase
MNMPVTRFGRTGLTVSRLALGTMTFGLQTDEPTSHAILDKAVGAGITLIDTANVYPLGGDTTTAGATEAIIGRWLAAGGPARRAGIVLATKAVGKMGPNHAADRRPPRRAGRRAQLRAGRDRAARRRLGQEPPVPGRAAAGLAAWAATAWPCPPSGTAPGWTTWRWR